MLKIIEQKDKNAYAALRAEFPAHVLVHITEAVEDSGAVSLCLRAGTGRDLCRGGRR